MEVKKALQLKSGDPISLRVHRKGLDGIPPTKVTRKTKGSQVNKTISGVDFIWVETNAGVWPSNRLK